MSDRFPRRRGIAFVYIIVAAFALVGFVSLAVDVGKVQTVKTELQRAADAAARAAVARMPNFDDAESLAVQYAALNTADGTTVVLDPKKDMDFGTWNESTKTFSVLNGSNRYSANALRIYCRRTSDNKNAVPLFFAPAIGRSTCDVQASAIAFMKLRFFGIAGVDDVKFSGSGTKLDSYDSGSGAYTNGSARNNVIVASNGAIKITGSTTVKGDARPGMGQSIQLTGGASVQGSTAPLDFVLSYPVPSAGSYATTNDNGSIPSSYLSAGNFTMATGQKLTLPGGNYYLNSLTVAVGAVLTFSGPTTIWMNGDFKLEGTMSTSGNIPANLKIRGVKAGTSIKLTSDALLYADILAPLSDIKGTGNSDVYGSVIGKTLEWTGNASIHYDEALGVSGVFGATTLVK